MNDEEWISSMDAARCTREAGFSTGDLAQWAETGALRSQTSRAWFGNDANGEERIFVGRQPRQRTEQGTNDTWPDIPAEFWYWLNRNLATDNSNWGAGVFATVVFEHASERPGDDHPSRDFSEYIRLHDVKFSRSDLRGLLQQKRPPTLKGVLPAHATKSDRHYEERAHAAAQIVREQGISPTAAFRKVMDATGRQIMRRDGSEESAVRRSFKLMYDAQGMPTKN